MCLKRFAFALQFATVIAGPASAQTAIEQQRQDVISSVVQIQEELAFRNERQSNTIHIGQNGNFNEIEVSQTGQRNAASIAMIGDHNGLQAVGLPASVRQNGTLNFVAAEIRGNDNFLEIDQMGAANTAVLLQNGGGAIHGTNTAGISQFQNGNVAKVIQNSIYADLFPGRSDNTFNVVQNGRNNSAFGEQIGAGNDGEIEQTGNGNFALLGQYGAENGSIISQTGDGLTAQSLQFGDFTDPITITQTAGAPPVFVTRGTR